MFKTEINYLAHHVSKKGVLPSKKNLQAIAECPPPDTYTKVKSFVGLVGHYRHFIKGFANIATPLYDLTSGKNKDKKLEHLDLPPEAHEAFDHYSTFDMNSGFWQVPMDEESKQYTTFTLGSMGLYECESMPFGLCNAPPTMPCLLLSHLLS